MSIHIRPAEIADAVAAIATVRASISSLCTADHQDDPDTLSVWIGNKTADNFGLWIANPDNFCVVAASDEAIAGVGLLHRSGEVRLFYLAPGCQRQGTGRALYRALEAQANRWGLARLHLDSTNHARPFYEAMGYRPVGSAVPRFGVLRCFPYEKWLRPNHSSKQTRKKPRAA